MRNRDNADVWTAVAIGAVVGIGATLLMRARQDDDMHAIIRRLQPLQKQARKATNAAGKVVTRRARQASDASGELVDAGRDILDDLRKGARDIVRATRSELRNAARSSVREARKAARRAAARNPLR